MSAVVATGSYLPHIALVRWQYEYFLCCLKNFERALFNVVSEQHTVIRYLSRFKVRWNKLLSLLPFKDVGFRKGKGAKLQ